MKTRIPWWSILAVKCCHLTASQTCNDQDYQQKLLEVVAGYKAQYGMSELAKRYAVNIANARFLWRNRVGAESVSVTVKHGNQSVTFLTTLVSYHCVILTKPVPS